MSIESGKFCPSMHIYIILIFIYVHTDAKNWNYTFAKWNFDETLLPEFIPTCETMSHIEFFSKKQKVVSLLFVGKITRT